MFWKNAADTRGPVCSKCTVFLIQMRESAGIERREARGSFLCVRRERYIQRERVGCKAMNMLRKRL